MSPPPWPETVNAPCSRAKLSDLPYDIVRTLCTIMSAPDIASMLATCKSLHVHMLDETIWKAFCTPHGVEDLVNTSFYRFYSGILYKYGPLLGLWASDRPYTGGIIEFRIDKEIQGIVGECWIYPDQYSTNLLTLPEYCLRDHNTTHSLHRDGVEQSYPQLAVCAW